MGIIKDSHSHTGEWVTVLAILVSPLLSSLFSQLKVQRTRHLLKAVLSQGLSVGKAEWEA